MRENCRSGSVRGGGSNAPTYSAVDLSKRCQSAPEGIALAQRLQVREDLQKAGVEGFLQVLQKQSPKQA